MGDSATWVEGSAEVLLPVVHIATGASKLLRVSCLGASSWEKYLDTQAEYVGTAVETHQFLLARPSLRHLGRVASVYVKPNGIVCLLYPHTHDEVAERVLKELYLSNEYAWDVHGTGLKYPVGFQHLTVLFGAIRAQFYPGGLGCSVICGSPLTNAQIHALGEYFRCTPGEESTTEVYVDGDPIKKLCGWGDTTAMVNRLTESGVTVIG